MSQYAKSIVAAVAAVLIAGIQAWQVAVDGRPFRLIDGLPIIVAIVGAFLTYLVPEVPELEKAKTWVAGAFAILTALATFTTGHPADVTVLNLIVAGLGAAVTSYVPNLGAEIGAVTAGAAVVAKATAGQPVGPADITDVLRQVEQLDPAVAAKSAAAPPAVPAAVPAADPVADERAVVTAALAHLDQLDAADLATASTATIPAQAPGAEAPATQPLQPAVVAPAAG